MNPGSIFSELGECLYLPKDLHHEFLVREIATYVDEFAKPRRGCSDPIRVAALAVAASLRVGASGRDLVAVRDCLMLMRQACDRVGALGASADPDPAR